MAVWLADLHYAGATHTLEGVVRVRNLGCTKRVYARVTCDEWATHTDVEAGPVGDVVSGHEGVFAITMQGTALPTLTIRPPPFSAFIYAVPFLAVPATVASGAQLSFALCYEVNDTTHWDNGPGGANYIVTFLV